MEIPGPPAVRLGASINGRWKWRGDTEFRDGGSTSGDRSVVRDFGVPNVEKLEHRRSVSPQDGRAAAIVSPRDGRALGVVAGRGCGRVVPRGDCPNLPDDDCSGLTQGRAIFGGPAGPFFGPSGRKMAPRDSF